MSRCRDTSNLVTVKLLLEGWNNVDDIASMTDKDSVENSVMNIHKPRGRLKGNMVSTMSEQKLHVFAFIIRYL